MNPPFWTLRLPAEQFVHLHEPFTYPAWTWPVLNLQYKCQKDTIVRKDRSSLTLAEIGSLMLIVSLLVYMLSIMLW